MSIGKAITVYNNNGTISLNEVGERFILRVKSYRENEGSLVMEYADILHLKEAISMFIKSLPPRKK